MSETSSTIEPKSLEAPDVIVIEALHHDTIVPRRATADSAGYDLYAYLDGREVTCSNGAAVWTEPASRADDRAGIELAPGAMALIPLGFRARLPKGFEAQVRPRSGAAFKRGLLIPNAPGTVDADYPDEWLVPVRNGSIAPLRIAHGERIAQMVLQRYETLPFTPGLVGASTERTGGFGSTGH